MELGCKKCGQTFGEIFFHKEAGRPNRNNRAYNCKKCTYARVKLWRKNNPIKHWERHRIDKMRYYRTSGAIKLKSDLVELRRKVLEKYGGRCVCCGERNHDFLQLDHVKDDGFKYRKKGKHKVGIVFYKSLVKGRRRGGVLQILCANCNMGKARNGGVCPHQSASNLHSLVPQTGDLVKHGAN